MLWFYHKTYMYSEKNYFMKWIGPMLSNYCKPAHWISLFVTDAYLAVLQLPTGEYKLVVTEITTAQPFTALNFHFNLPDTRRK